MVDIVKIDPACAVEGQHRVALGFQGAHGQQQQHRAVRQAVLLWSHARMTHLTESDLRDVPAVAPAGSVVPVSNACATAKPDLRPSS